MDPGSKGELESLGAADLRFMGEDGTRLSWQFAPGNRVSLDGGQPAGYGALTLDHVTLIAHLVPGTTRGYAIAWDQRNNRATVAELWFGRRACADRARSQPRAAIMARLTSVGAVSGERCMRPPCAWKAARSAWTEDTGVRTVEYYPSVTYTHWVELDRLKGKVAAIRRPPIMSS